MELTIIFKTIIIKYWRESLIALLSATIFYLHLNNNILESELALEEQKNVQVEERLKVSNGTIDQLQIQIDNQNNKLQELSDKSKEKQETLKGQLEEAKQKVWIANKNLEEYINSTEGLTDDLCFDTLNELLKIGE